MESLSSFKITVSIDTNKRSGKEKFSIEDHESITDVLESFLCWCYKEYPEEIEDAIHSVYDVSSEQGAY